MSWYSDDSEKAAVSRKIERLQKDGDSFAQLTLSARGNKIAHTFWGHAWCRHLESHSDYENRLPRGRSYLRQGNVYDLQIQPGRVTASVAGSSLYEVEINIQPLHQTSWTEFKDECAGQVGSLLDLLSGKLGDGVLRTITDPDTGLFPKSKEFRFSCSCPDWADMCKHVAAVLYGVGVKLDTAPDLFFVLRSVDPGELLTQTAHDTLSQVQSTDEALAGEDLSALFGIELAEPGEPSTPETDPKPAVKAKKPRASRAPKPKAKKPKKPRD